MRLKCVYNRRTMEVQKTHKRGTEDVFYLNALYCLYTIPSSSKRKHNGDTANSNCVISAAILSLPPSDKFRVRQAYRTKSCSSWEAKIFNLSVWRKVFLKNVHICQQKFKKQKSRIRQFVYFWRLFRGFIPLPNKKRYRAWKQNFKQVYLCESMVMIWKVLSSFLHNSIGGENN